MIYKNIEPLCCTPETNIILKTNFTSIKKKKKKDMTTKCGPCWDPVWNKSTEKKKK